jgi:hypothetical protein
VLNPGLEHDTLVSAKFAEIILVSANAPPAQYLTFLIATHSFLLTMHSLNLQMVIMTKPCHSSNQNSGDPHPTKHKAGTPKYNLCIHESASPIHQLLHLLLILLQDTSELSVPCFIPQDYLNSSCLYLLKVDSIDILVHHLHLQKQSILS